MVMLTTQERGGPWYERASMATFHANAERELRVQKVIRVAVVQQLLEFVSPASRIRGSYPCWNGAKEVIGTADPLEDADGNEGRE